MSVQGVSNSGAQGNSTSSLSAPSTETGAQAFLDYMKETPAQRMEDAWLSAHHLTRQQLAEMSPAQRQAIMNQMEQDIQREIKEKAESKLYKSGAGSM
jgi:hypothetical protein